MPSYQDHLLFGSVLVLVFAYVAGPLLSYGPEMLLVTAAFILLASVFPDVDHRGSIVHRRVKGFAVLVAMLAPALLLRPDPDRMVAGAALGGAATYVGFDRITPRHRTVTHTMRFGTVFAAAAGMVGYLLFGSFLPAAFTFVAYGSHVLLDRVM